MTVELHLTDRQLEKVESIFERSPVLGQGNPAISIHPMTPEECRAVRSHAAIVPPDPRCGATNMVPIYNPEVGETAEQARAWQLVHFRDLRGSSR